MRACLKKVKVAYTGFKLKDYKQTMTLDVTFAALSVLREEVVKTRRVRDIPPAFLRFTHLILGDNRTALAQALGRAVFHYRREFDFHCWPVEFEDCKYVVLTAKGKGTCYERVTAGEKAEVDVRFLQCMGQIISQQNR